jgi:uncharacterized protein involved in outer membrane biogenesis
LRIILTIVALLLVSALTAALIGPYYVDWSKQRSVVEAQLSRILGERMEVKGPIDLKLLPTPYIALNQVKITDSRTGGVLFDCDRMELSLGLSALVRGQFRFTQASFDGPTLRVVRAPEGGIALPKLDFTKSSGSISFDSVAVRDGHVKVSDADGTAETDLGGIELEAEAESLLGPFRGSGSAPGPGRMKLAFNFATGAVDGASLRFKAAVSAGSGASRSEYDGAIALAGATSMSGAAALGYSGAATFSGLIEGADAPTPWRASGALKASLSGASLDNLEVRVGPEDRALSATGAAQMQFGAAPHASVALAAKQLNFDALLHQESDASASPAAVYRALSAAWARREVDSGPPVALSLALQTPAMIIGGDTIADVALSVEASPNASTSAKLEAGLPGRTHILASGVVDDGPAAGFKGRIDLRIGDAPRLGDWLTSGAPDMSARLASVSEVLPYRSASATGDIDLSATGFVMRNLSLVLERSTFTGTLALTRSVGSERGRMFMDLQTDSLDVDALPNVSAGRVFLGDIDLSLALDAHAIRIARLGEAEVEGGSLTLKLTKDGDDLRLDRFSIANLGGASVEANGASDTKGRWLSAKIDAARLRDFALLVRRVAPGTISEAFVDRSEALSPAKLTFSAQSSGPGRDIAESADTVTILGMAGVTRVDAKLDRPAGVDSELSVIFSLDAPDAAPLLRQIGLSALSLDGQGRGHIGVSAHGHWSGGLDANVSASLAGSDLAWRGRLTPLASDLDSTLFDGTASLKAGNALPLLAILAVAPSDAGTVPVDLSADVVGRDAQFKFARVRGSIGRARLKGDLTYRSAPLKPPFVAPADPDMALAQAVAGDDSAALAPQLEGELQIDRLPFSALTTLALGAPQPARSGALWSDLKFSAGLVNPPSADILLKVAALDVTDSLLAQSASLRLKLGRGLVGLDDFSMNVGGGGVSGRATIRRDGPNASMSGHVSLDPVALDRPNFVGQLAGSLDFASTGQSSSALVSGLAGTGQIRLTGARIPRLDQGAIGRVLEKAQSPDYAIDQLNIDRALESELNKQPLRITDAAAPASLTAGVLRFGPFEAKVPGDNSVMQANFDLRSFVLEIQAAFTELRTPKYWTGAPPAITIVMKGSVESSAREVDSGLFVAGLAAQAIARETDRIAALESDIRERAFFNRRLKAGQFMRRRELELASYATEKARLKSEEDRRRVEAETLRADEERRKIELPDQTMTPSPSSNDAPSLTTNPAPPNPLPPVPMPRPPSPSRQADPTASGLY